MDILEILWDLHQQNRISRTEEQVQSSSNTIDALRDQLASVNQRLDHANLVVLAMWELMGERLGLKPEQLRERVAEIDLRDGVRDGKYTGDIPTCTGCGRKIPPHRERCMYCGAERQGLGAADLL